MSLEGLFNSRSSVHRPTGTRDEFGGGKSTLAAHLTNQRCGVSNPFRMHSPDRGPGDMQVGRWTAYYKEGTDVIMSDVIEITDGPEEGRWFKVEEVWKPRGHHVEVAMEPYHGPRL